MLPKKDPARLSQIIVFRNQRGRSEGSTVSCLIELIILMWHNETERSEQSPLL